MNSRRSTYRIWRQVDGVPSFAEVEVSLGEDGGFEPLSTEIPAGWVEMARSGIASALGMMGESLPRPELRRLVFSFVDTTDDSVFAAAFLATARLLGREGEFSLRRISGRWSISHRDDKAL